MLDPIHGIIVGDYPLVSDNGTVDSDKYKFWVDNAGNLFFKGTLKATTGEFTGKVTATSGYIGGSTGWTIESTYIYNGKPSYSNTTQGIYIGTNGISLGDANHYVKMSKDGALSANNATITGKITTGDLYADGGTIGGWTINGGKMSAGGTASVHTAAIQAPSDSITWVFAAGGSSHSSYSDCPFRVNKNGDLYATSATIEGNIKATSGTIGGCSINSSGSLQVTNGHIVSMSASKLTAGTIDANSIDVQNLHADQITVGTIKAGQISGLPASKISSGVFSVDRIPVLSADHIDVGSITIGSGQVTGTFSATKISGGTLSGCSINIGNYFKVSSTGTVTLGYVDNIYIYSNSAGLWNGRHQGITDAVPYMNNTIDQFLMYFACGIMIGYGDN